MSANVEAMVREGINAYKAGRKEEARALLLKATELDQYNEQAWLWLSGLMETPEDQRTCLENVLAIDPNNERAKQGLAFLTGQTVTGNVSPFAASAAPPSAPSPTSPTSVEWAPAEPAPAPMMWNKPPPVEPSPDVLDDWVSNLNLQSSSSDNDRLLLDSAAASPFGDFDVEDDIFTGGPFGATTTFEDLPASDPNPPASRSRRSPVPSESPTEPPPPATRRSQARASAPPRSPTPTRTPAADRNSLLYDIDQDEDEIFLEEGDGELFGFIPPEIVPTRLPGTRERLPILYRLAVVVLILLNIGAASLLMLGLFS